MRSQNKKLNKMPFYKTWWFGLFIGVLVSVSGISLGKFGFFTKREKKVAELEVEQVVEESEEALADDVDIEEEKEFTYEDFKGTYINFEGEPYASPIMGMTNILVLEDNIYRTFNRWDFDMTSEIVDTLVEDNELTLELDSAENEVWGKHSETGTEKFQLNFDENRKYLQSLSEDQKLYSIMTEDLQNYYTQAEIDYARIIMTVNDVPSIDQWAVWHHEYDNLVVRVSESSKGSSTFLYDEILYPEDVIHLDLTEYGEDIITFSIQSEGYITVYPIPTLMDESEDVRHELTQKWLDNAYTIYIEEFETYEVANFIGHVEFEEK